MAHRIITNLISLLMELVLKRFFPRRHISVLVFERSVALFLSNYFFPADRLPCQKDIHFLFHPVNISSYHLSSLCVGSAEKSSSIMFYPLLSSYPSLPA